MESDVVADAGAESEAAVPDPEPIAPLETRVAELSHFVCGQPLSRELMYAVLGACSEARTTLGDLERMIEGMPQAKSAVVSPCRIVEELVGAGGLVQIELDADGAEITPERTRGLTEDEVDDLVADFAYETTDAGRALARETAPDARMRKLFADEAEHTDALMDVLDVLQSARTLGEVDTALRERGRIRSAALDGDTPLQPSVFIDLLERAGGIVWDGGWRLTDAGRAWRAAHA